MHGSSKIVLQTVNFKMSINYFKIIYILKISKVSKLVFEMLY